MCGPAAAAACVVVYVCVCGRVVGSVGKGVFIQGGERERDGVSPWTEIPFVCVRVSLRVFIFLCTVVILLTAETAVLCTEADKKKRPH